MNRSATTDSNQDGRFTDCIIGWSSSIANVKARRPIRQGASGAEDMDVCRAERLLPQSAGGLAMAFKVVLRSLNGVNSF